jgi:hypothetical protein
MYNTFSSAYTQVYAQYLFNMSQPI